jgi:predicted metal-binding protein
MAETRAKARGLRDAVNVSVAAVEELGASEEEFREVEETYRETLLANLQSEARKQGYVPQAIGRALEKWSGYSDEQLVSALDEMRNTDG